MNSTIKIFVDASQFNKEFQGSRTYIKELYTQLAISFPDAGVYFAMMKDEKIEEMFKDSRNIHFIHLKRKDWLGRMVFEIPGIIKKGDFTHAHFQYTIPFRRSNKCKYIVTIHDILFNEFKNLFPLKYRISRNILFAYSARNADIVLTVSAYSKRKIAEQYAIEENKIHITPNGVGQEFYNNYNKVDNQKEIKRKYGIENYFLYVSRVEPRKNQLQLLNAFIKLPDKTKQLVFIGKRSLLYPEFENALVDLKENYSGRVHFIEQVEHQDLLMFYRAASLFIYPSLAEGFGIPPLEAAASKIPVICSNATAMEDFNFFKPYCYDASVPGLLEEKIQLLLNNFDEYNATLISDEIKKRYSWSSSAEVLKKLILQF